MENIIAVNKPIGITSYDVIRELKKKYPKQKIGHAGTLDPLADGVLICLIGSDATKRQSEFMNVSKDYVFDIFFGCSTDTYDILGLISENSQYLPIDATLDIRKVITNYAGKIVQKVPPFSAVKIKGKPLYRWYLDGQISEVEIPEKDIEIEKINIVSETIIKKDEVSNQIVSLLNLVKSGFRQTIVVKSWQDYFSMTTQEEFLVVRVKATVSKGTYVRAIANDIGKKIGIPACTITITRTRVGGYELPETVSL